MSQLKQLELPMPKQWDAINQRPFDTEHQRSLEGLPHYWRISWGIFDTIILPCGHKRQVYVDNLADPNINFSCPYGQLGGCNG